MRYLFTTLGALGHFHPLVPFARALSAAGHEVAFATSAAFVPTVEASGFGCFAVGGVRSVREIAAAAGVDLDAMTPAERRAWVGPNKFAGAHVAERVRDLLRVAEEWRPDAFVREEVEFGGCVAAERLGLPHAAVQLHAQFPNGDGRAAPLDGLRAAAGLPPDPARAMQYRYLLLSPFPPSFQHPDGPLPPTGHALRVEQFDRSGDEELPAWVADLPPRPTVYATFGSAFNSFAAAPPAFAAVLSGLAGEPVNVVATVGRAQDPASSGPQPPHVRVERYVPQSLLLPRCDVVVCHGGSGTLLGALSHGLPLVAVPFGADHPENAALVEALGVGRAVEPATLTPATAREVIRHVLADPSYRRSAERIRAQIDALPGVERAVELLERLARERKPVCVPV